MVESHLIRCRYVHCRSPVYWLCISTRYKQLSLQLAQGNCHLKYAVHLSGICFRMRWFVPQRQLFLSITNKSNFSQMGTFTLWISMLYACTWLDESHFMNVSFFVVIAWDWIRDAHNLTRSTSLMHKKQNYTSFYHLRKIRLRLWIYVPNLIWTLISDNESSYILGLYSKITYYFITW